MSSWESHYQNGRPRRWPNEMLVSWVLRTYGHLSAGERKVVDVLEVGCGAGGNLRFLAEEGFTPTGIDIAESAVVQCQARGYVSLVRNILFTMFPDAIFNCVVDVTSLQHLTEVQHLYALREIHRLLKPGGYLWSYRLAAGTVYEDIFPKQPPVWLATPCQLHGQITDEGFRKTLLLSHDRQYTNGWARYLMVEAMK